MVENLGTIDTSCVKIQVEDAEQLELSLLCRVCATTNEYLIPIFEDEGKENSLAEKIQSHLAIKVKPSDDYPDNICYPCASTLLAFHDLVNCCKEAGVILKARIDKGESIHKKNEVPVPESPVKNKKHERSLRGRCPPGVSQHATKGKKLANSRVQLHWRTNKLKHPNESVKEPLPVTNPQICSFCSQSFKDSDVLTNHLLDSHADLLFRCDVCGLYLDRKELIPHMSKHAEQYNENLRKQETESNSKEPEQSQNSKTNDTKTPTQNVADTDAFSTTSRSNDGFGPLPESVFEAIKDTDETVEPKKCAEIKNDQSGEKSKNEKQKSCENDESSKAKKSNEANKKICPICSKEFRLTSSYYYHKKHYHGGLKEHECNICGRSFALKSALKEHSSIHSGTKPYSCPQCSKEFRTKASVYIHYKNIHCETKQFKCTVCNRSFRWKQKLLRHASSHTKEKKHFCAKCGKGFGVKYDLTRHMKSHIESKAFSCHKCEKHFSQLRYLNKHIKTKHSTAKLECPNQTQP